MTYEEFKKKSGEKLFGEIHIGNREKNEKELELQQEFQKLLQILDNLLESYHLPESKIILNRIIFMEKRKKTNESNGKTTQRKFLKKLKEEKANFLESIQHLNSNDYEKILNVFKNLAILSEKIIALEEQNDDLQDNIVESSHEKNENQSVYSIPKTIEEQQAIELKEIIEHQEENDEKKLSKEQEEIIFTIDWKYVDNLALAGQWQKRADYFDELAKKIAEAPKVNSISFQSKEYLEYPPVEIDERYEKIYLECLIEYEKAKKISELIPYIKEKNERYLFNENPIEINYKKLESLSLEQRKFYILDCIREIITTPFHGGNGYLVSLGDKIYTIDKKYAEIYNQYIILYKKNEKELRKTEIDEITQTAEDYVNLKNKIMHKISISNMEYYDYESQKDKEEIDAIVKDVNKYLYLQGRLKYFMKDPKEHHLLEDSFDVDKIFAIYEKFNKKEEKTENQESLNISEVPVKTEAFKINWKEISKLSIKDKIEALEQAMVAMIKAPKENPISVNVDDTSYSINKKDERTFKKCYKEYKKVYFPVYNNNFSAKFSQIMDNDTIEIFEQPANVIDESQVQNNSKKLFQKRDKIFNDIINKISYGIKVIKVLPASLSQTIMKRVQLGTLKVKAGTCDMLDENIYRKDNRYGR